MLKFCIFFSRRVVKMAMEILRFFKVFLPGRIFFQSSSPRADPCDFMQFRRDLGANIGTNSNQNSTKTSGEFRRIPENSGVKNHAFELKSQKRAAIFILIWSLIFSNN